MKQGGSGDSLFVTVNYCPLDALLLSLPEDTRGTAEKTLALVLPGEERLGRGGGHPRASGLQRHHASGHSGGGGGGGDEGQGGRGLVLKMPLLIQDNL